MQKIIITSIVLFFTLVTTTFAQEKSFEAKANEIAKSIEKIQNEEKEILKKQVADIEKQYENGVISQGETEALKVKAANERAAIIEKRIAQEQTRLQQLVQDKVDGKYPNDSLNYEPGHFAISVKMPKNPQNKYDTIAGKVKEPKRTTSQFVFATGFNNLVTNGAVANSDFKYLRSTFYEWGVTGRTRILKENNLLHFKYGFSFMYNILSASENRVFQDNGAGQTNLVTYPVDLKSKHTYFKNVFLAIPLHLEFDFGKDKTVDGNKYYGSHNGMRLGIGGYVGYNTNSKQFLAYDDSGYRISQKIKGDWNVDDFNYGLSAYIGHGSTSLYVKYDLNPMFKNNTVDQNNVSLGIRFDIN